MSVSFHTAVLLVAAVILLLSLVLRNVCRARAVVLPLPCEAGTVGLLRACQVSQWLPATRWDLREARRGSPRDEDEFRFLIADMVLVR